MNNKKITKVVIKNLFIKQRLWDPNTPLFLLVIIIFPLVLILPHFLWPYMRNNPDTWHYLSSALNLARGQGYVGTDGLALDDRTPLVPIFISFFMRLFGPQTSYIGVISLSLLFGVGLFYVLFIGEKYIKRGVGITGVAVLAALPYIQDLAFMRVMTDGPQAVFLIIALYWAFQVLENNHNFEWMLLGVALGLSFLTKQSAVLWFPLPIFLWLFQTDLEANIQFYKPFISYIFTGLIIFPWFFYIYVSKGELFLVDLFTSQVGKIFSNKTFSSLFLEITGLIFALLFIFLIIFRRKIRHYLQSFINPMVRRNLGLVLIGVYLLVTFTEVRFGDVIKYIRTSIQPIYPFYLALASWAIIFFPRFLKIKRTKIILSFVLVFSIPVLLIISRWNSQPRNLVAWMMVSCLVMAFVAQKGVIQLISVFRNKKFNVQRMAESAAVFLFVGCAVYSGYSNFNEAARRKDVSYQWKVAKQVEAWLIENLLPGESLLASWRGRSEIFTMTNGIFRMTPIFPEQADGWKSLDFSEGTLFTEPQSRENPVLVRLIDPDPGRTNHLVVLYPGDLVNSIQSTGSGYILITGEQKLSPLGLYNYFDCVPYAERVWKTDITNSTGAVIYKIDPTRLNLSAGCPTISDAATIDWILKEGRKSRNVLSPYEIMQGIGEDIVLFPGDTPEAIATYLAMGDIYADNGEGLAALRAFERASAADLVGVTEHLASRLQENPGHEIYTAVSVEILAQNQIADLAGSNVDQMLAGLEQQYPGSGFVHYIAGLHRLRVNDAAGAVSSFTQAVKQDESQVQYSIELYHAYLRQSDFDRAQAVMDALMAANPDMPLLVKENNQLLAAKLFAQNQVTSAVALLNASSVDVKRQPTRATVTNLLDDLPTQAQSAPGSLVYRSYFTLSNAREVLFMHPPAMKQFQAVIPAGARLIAYPALSKDVWNSSLGDGVEFNIDIEVQGYTERVYSRYIDPKNIPDDRVWQSVNVNLTPWAGQTVTITFSTTPGPNGDANYDWAGWGEPRITVPVQYDFASQFKQAVKSADYPDQLRTDQMNINYETRAVIFAHPHSRVIYNLTLSADPTLMFGIGLDPAVWDAAKGDGVEFNVYVVRPEEPWKLYRVYQRYLDPKNNPSDRAWVDERVNLSRFAGQDVQIIFETTAGPAGNIDFDWAGWSRPVLVDGLGAAQP